MPRKKVENKNSKASQKKPSLDELNQAHGKQEGVEPTSLDQIWGDSGVSKFKTLDQDEYQNQLDDMNKSDLQTHATKVGLVPIDDVNMLKKRLMKEFTKHVSSFRTPKTTKGSKNMSKKALKILGEGK
tara:strand:- start:114 stop:497 length:384 start_codon:yes stop_codon:yes gene_type:complete